MTSNLNSLITGLFLFSFVDRMGSIWDCVQVKFKRFLGFERDPCLISTKKAQGSRLFPTVIVVESRASMGNGRESVRRTFRPDR